MNALERLIPTPRLLEINRADLAADAATVFERVRHSDLGGSSALIRALFRARELPRRMRGSTEPAVLGVDALRSTPERPGFTLLADDPPREFAVGAIGQVWQLAIPFVHVADAEAFAAFAEPGQIKVAWAMRAIPIGEHASTLEFELRVDATDDEAWRKFRRYFSVIGIGSHLIRHTLLAGLSRELGTPEAQDEARALAGDALLPDASAQITQAITIAAPPQRIWPWLVQMGGGRAGFYSLDMLDNGGKPSARELHPELARLAVGDVIAARPDGQDGFEVLQLEPERTLLLGGLFDAAAHRQLAFAAVRPQRYWHVTWAFVLQPLDDRHTRLLVRARAAFPSSGRLHALFIRPVHRLMQSVQLRNLAARAEGRLRRDSARDVLEGVGGAGTIAGSVLTPFLRSRRERAGLDAAAVAATYPGDDLVQRPRCFWTHAVEVDAPARAVWPWLAQIGADRGGFYSYQWLENLVGCELRNAETVHPEWALHRGDDLVLHPNMPPLRVIEVEPGRHLLSHAPADPAARAAGQPWVAASWLFALEPLGEGRCRVLSRFRSDYSNDLPTRLASGPALVEPVGFVMDRRMLRGIKARAERTAHTGAARTVDQLPG